MRNRLLSVVALSAALAGCQTYSETPSGSFEVAGDYNAVADCTYLKVRSGGYWKKEDFASIKTVQLTLGTSTTSVGRIDLIGVAEGKTRAEIRFQTPIQGKDYYPNLYRPIISACAGK